VRDHLDAVDGDGHSHPLKARFDGEIKQLT
jgi:hypothetical protein